MLAAIVTVVVALSGAATDEAAAEDGLSAGVDRTASEEPRDPEDVTADLADRETEEPAEPAEPAVLRPGDTGAEVEALQRDLDRQVLRVAEDGALETVLHVATGHAGTYEHPDGDTRVATTPTGSYQIERRIDGWRHAPLGDLYRPAYFVGGIAIHGYTDVPAEPASSGCVRVTLEAMDHLWSHGRVTEGTVVIVH